jgi:hypothetical protein
MEIEHEVMADGVCQICGPAQFSLRAIQHYGHLWWIPFFPTDKSFFLTCIHCGSTITNNDVEKLVADVDIAAFKTPLMSYIGFLLIILFVPFAAMTMANVKREEAVHHPKHYEIKHDARLVQANDFLILHSEQKLGYVLARVLKVDNQGNITFQFSKWLYKQLTNLTSVAQQQADIFQDDFYQEDYYETTLNALKEDFKIKQIISRTDHPNHKTVGSTFEKGYPG